VKIESDKIVDLLKAKKWKVDKELQDDLIAGSMILLDLDDEDGESLMEFIMFMILMEINYVGEGGSGDFDRQLFDKIDETYSKYVNEWYEACCVCKKIFKKEDMAYHQCKNCIEGKESNIPPINLSW